MAVVGYKIRHISHSCCFDSEGQAGRLYNIIYLYKRPEVKRTISGINYFADLRMTFRQNFFLQDWFRN
jgi:hypothetical protein